MKKIILLFAMALIVSASHAQIKLGSYVVTIGDADTYPVTLDSLGKGGLMVTHNRTTRNAIPAARRKSGMYVSYSSADSLFKLIGGVDNEKWVYQGKVSNIGDITGLQAALDGKANLTVDNTFFGNQTLNGNLYMPLNSWVAYDNTSPLAPIHVGDRTDVLNSSLARVLVAGVYDNSFSQSGHAFSDGTLITGVGGGKAYAAYDGRVDIQGSSVNMDHYVSFQHGPTMNFNGTLKDNFGLFTATVLAAGTITNNYGAHLANPITAGGAVIGDNYGIYIANQTAGVNNYGVYSDGGNNYFKGNTIIDGVLELGAIGEHLRLKVDGTTDKDGGIYSGLIGDIVLGNWDQTRGFSVLPTGEGKYFGGDFDVTDGSVTAINFNGDLSGNASTVSTINGKITAGSNISLSGLGTTASPYSISSTGGSVGDLQDVTDNGATTTNAITAGAIFANGGAAMTGGWKRTTQLSADYTVLSLHSTAGSKYAGIGYDGGDGLSFWVNSAADISATGYQMTLKNNGNLGVGTTSPSEKLHVNGNGFFNGTVTAGGDVEVSDLTKGVILKSPNGTRYRITVSDSGTLTTTAL